MSISKAQAEALAEGFLDSIGVDRVGLFPKETYSELILLAGELIQDAQQNLIRSNSISSGALSGSLVAEDPRQEGNIVAIDVLMNFYGLFVNAGVKGTRAGGSTAGYSFKNEIVGRKMLAAIEEWLKRGKISTATIKKRKYSPYGSHERKQAKLGALHEADAAYAVARSIKQKGIKATGFLDAAVRTTRAKVSDRLGAALKIDIINSLTS